MRSTSFRSQPTAVALSNKAPKTKLSSQVCWQVHFSALDFQLGDKTRVELRCKLRGIGNGWKAPPQRLKAVPCTVFHSFPIPRNLQCNSMSPHWKSKGAELPGGQEKFLLPELEPKLAHSSKMFKGKFNTYSVGLLHRP